MVVMAVVVVMVIMWVGVFFKVEIFFIQVGNADAFPTGALVPLWLEGRACRICWLEGRALHFCGYGSPRCSTMMPTCCGVR